MKWLINLLFKKREFIICEVIYVNVAAPSSKDKPLINDISKSFVSIDLLEFILL